MLAKPCSSPPIAGMIYISLLADPMMDGRRQKRGRPIKTWTDTISH